MLTFTTYVSVANALIGAASIAMGRWEVLPANVAVWVVCAIVGFAYVE